MRHHDPETVREAAREQMHAAGETLEEGFDRAQDAVGQADVWLRERVVEQPLLALGAAAVAGYVLGRLISKGR